MAPARSIQCMRRPPRRAPSGLASLGRTISAISDWESRTGLGNAKSSSFGVIGLCSKWNQLQNAFYVKYKTPCNTRPFSGFGDQGGFESTGLAASRIGAHDPLPDGNSSRKSLSAKNACHFHKQYRSGRHRTYGPMADGYSPTRIPDYILEVHPRKQSCLDDRARSRFLPTPLLTEDARDVTTRLRRNDDSA